MAAFLLPFCIYHTYLEKIFQKGDGEMRGCERRIIMLKGTDSEIFDEAYFLLRKDFKNEEGDAEMVSEAKRIVSLNTTRRRKRANVKKEALVFALGILLGAAASVIFYIIF